MIVLKTIAPVLTDLVSIAGAGDHDAEGYAALWSAVGRQLTEESGGGVRVTFEHAKQVSGRSRYASIQVDSLTRSPHLLTFTVDPTRFFLDGGSRASLPAQFHSIEEITLRVYPHGVSLLEVTALLSDPPTQSQRDDGGQPLSDRWLDDMQETAVIFTEEVAEELLRRSVAHTLSLVHQNDSKSRFFQPGGIQRETGKVLWASRSLLVEPRHRWLLQHWTRGAVDAERQHLRDALLNGESDSLMRWLNYAFVDSNNEGIDAFRLDASHAGTFATHYSGLRYAQYVYASLDHVGGRLGTVLAEAVGATAKWELEALKDDLVELSQRAELIIMERQDLLKYMNRDVRTQFKELLDAWDYAELVEDPVQFKIELCNRRLQELAEKRAARSNLVTDLILLGIGITSIAGMAIAITDFGRSSAGSAISTVYDLGASGFTDWFMTQPIDVILLTSAAASTVIIALYLFFRRDNGV